MAKPDAPTHEQLAAAAAGDPAAREALLHYGMPVVQRYLGRRMGPFLRSLETSADLAQSVCGEVLTELSGFDGRSGAGFRRWLLLRAEHKVLKRFRFHRQEKRDAARTTPLANHGDAPVAPTDGSPSRHAMVNEEWQRMRTALAALPDDYRQVILLSRVAGLPPEQVAARMGRSREAVWSLLSRALARLAVVAESSS